MPTCRQTPVELAHIIPWAKCQKHEFENLIALCPTCPTRFDRGDIDKKSIEMYKQSLSVLNSRYGDYEQRILQHFIDNPEAECINLPFGQNTEILLMYLLRDGLLVDQPDRRPVTMSSREREFMWYALTDKGKFFIYQWKSAKKIE
ncbi:HNH endonuclease [Cyanobacteria bacterium FACHB-63]|nr:HNH endonuclease [Cyanobacteria bacterium FACHB-63]